VVVASDVFGAMIAGVLVSAIIAGVAELARFSRWRRFFAAFFEIPEMVSMVTKIGNSGARCLRTEVSGNRV